MPSPSGAHEAHAHGVSLSKGAKVFTVFSTSKDHHQGRQASCGCILIDVEKIQVIVRSPHYRNRYVHKRNSMSLIGIPQDEINRRKQIGLVVDDFDDDDDDGRRVPGRFRRTRRTLPGHSRLSLVITLAHIAYAAAASRGRGAPLANVS